MVEWDGKTLWASGTNGVILGVFGNDSSPVPFISWRWADSGTRLPPMSDTLRVLFENLTESQAWMPLLDRIAEEWGDEIAQPFLDSYHRGA